MESIIVINILDKIEEWAFTLASTEKIVKQYQLIEPHDNLLYENKLFKVLLVDVNKDTFLVKYTLRNCDEPSDIIYATALIYEPHNIKFHRIRR